jgi:hypothetical protein
MKNQSLRNIYHIGVVLILILHEFHKLVEILR